jgi:pimeloyl-ACP methyl ester carboxylesterase
VFVHGGWADATGFDGSIRALRDRGFAVIGAANPLRHLTGDIASLAALLGTISGPIVLVGHSYGGAVMSNAATGNEHVQAPVFVAGWMPDEGESIQQLLEGEGSLRQSCAGGTATGAVVTSKGATKIN